MDTNRSHLRAVARLTSVVACAVVCLVLPQGSFASCTPHAAKPVVRSGHVLAAGRAICDVGTPYRYELCLQRRHPAASAPVAWTSVSCSGKQSWHGSAVLTSDAGPRHGAFRSRLTLWLPGRRPSSAVSAVA
ncbi:MAG TPA: hypothetical protein VGK92_13285 [Gaiellales bacterium]|jgi:hypothetical protein